MVRFFYFLAFAIVFSFQACGQETYEEYLESLYSKTVPLMQPTKLHELLENEKDVHLLDTRTKEEFKVSHIPGARRIGYDNFTMDQIADVPKDAHVVLYCTVGYRSEKVGEILKENGYENVHNVYGSILKWKNNGYKVVNSEGEPTNRVHTHGEKQAQWLNNGKAVYE